MTGKELLSLLQQLPEESLSGEVLFSEYGDEYEVSSISCEITIAKDVYDEYERECKIILST